MFVIKNLEKLMKKINVHKKFIFVTYIIFFKISSMTLIEKTEIDKFSPEAKLNAGIELLIPNKLTHDQSEIIEDPDVLEWLNKNLANLKNFINTSFLEHTPLEKYFSKWSSLMLFKLTFWKELIKAGANPNIQLKFDYLGNSNSPVVKHDSEILKLNSYYTDLKKYICTLFHLCAIFNDVETAQFLAGHGMFINEKDSLKRTALHLAVLSYSEDIVNYLIIDCNGINSIINKDAQDTLGKTAAHLAVECNNLPALKLLKQYQADFSVRTAKGKTALDIAKKLKNLAAIKIIAPEKFYDIENKLNSRCDII